MTEAEEQASGRIGDGMEALWQCVTCSGSIAGTVFQCPGGHPLCALCVDVVRGLCPCCEAPVGRGIRNLVVEKLRDGREAVGDIILCAICTRDYNGKIYQCTGGHLICGECRQRCQLVCPHCRVDMKKVIRNMPLEQFLKPLKQCRNVVRGCTRIVRVDEQGEHERVCEHGRTIYQCRVANCEWKGYDLEQVGHYVTAHNFTLGTNKVTRCGDYVLSAGGLFFGFMWQSNAVGNTVAGMFPISPIRVVSRVEVSCVTLTDDQLPSRIDFADVRVDRPMPFNQIVECQINCITFH